MHPVVCRILPSYWRGRGYVKSAKTLLGPKIQQLLRKNDEGLWSPNGKEDAHLLAWLADTAKGSDRDPNKLAHVEVLLALASVHTTLLRMINVVYDLTAHPQYIDELREEISAAAENDPSWTCSVYVQLPKLDSILRESQRLSPPTILGMKRLFKAPYTFSNGMHVDPGTYVCLPTYAIENANAVNPKAFDGLRSYRLRQHEGERDEHQFVSTEPTVLNFGYGKSACPGRYFASLILKILFVKLLTEYDFQFLPGKERPRNLVLHEFLFPRPWDRMLFKQRSKRACPF